jgi:hypothetical protein
MGNVETTLYKQLRKGRIKTVKKVPLLTANNNLKNTTMEFIYTAKKTTPKPKYKHSIMFIEGNEYVVIPAEKVKKEAFSRLCEWDKTAIDNNVGIDEEDKNIVYQGFLIDAILREDFIKVSGIFRDKTGKEEQGEHHIFTFICNDYLVLNSG